MMEPIRVIELFAGIGAQHQALKQANIPHDVVAISEIDPGAVRAYEAIHGKVNNLGDITKVEHLPDCDLLTYSFPCQDLSVAGKRKGMAKGSGTRSGLLWEVERLLVDMRERVLTQCATHGERGRHPLRDEHPRLHEVGREAIGDGLHIIL